MKALNSAKALLGIVLLTLRLVPRIWAVLLIVVNAFSIFFLDTRYGQVVLAAVMIGALAMIAIHMRLGFVRLLGVGHVLWIPMLMWIVMDFPKLELGSLLRHWLLLLIVVNTISLVIDCIDVARYIRGERAPHYSWD